jgi:hypothetical protein
VSIHSYEDNILWRFFIETTKQLVGNSVGKHLMNGGKQKLQLGTFTTQGADVATECKTVTLSDDSYNSAGFESITAVRQRPRATTVPPVHCGPPNLPNHNHCHICRRYSRPRHGQSIRPRFPTHHLLNISECIVTDCK